MRKGVGEFGIRVVLSAVVMIALQGCYDTSGGNAGGSDGDSDSDTDSDTDADTDNDTDTSVDCGGWLDETSGLCWQLLPDFTAQTWADTADQFCNDMVDSGHSDWRMPTIDELRALLRNCPATVSGGSCPITHGIEPSEVDLEECTCDVEDGPFVTGDYPYPNELVSARYMAPSGDQVSWMVIFSGAAIKEAWWSEESDQTFSFRCVRDQ